jgi:hypothetical protein
MSRQLTQADLDGMTAEQIADSTVRGELDSLLRGRTDAEVAVEQARADWLAAKEAATEADDQKPTPVDQGARGGPRSGEQVTAAELATMSAEQIVKAQNEGRLTDLLGG